METNRANSTPSSNVATEEAVPTGQTSASTETVAAPSQPNLALDACRGLIMILLVSDGFGFQHLVNNPLCHGIAYQFDHHWGKVVGMRGSR